MFSSVTMIVGPYDSMRATEPPQQYVEQHALRDGAIVSKVMYAGDGPLIYVCTCAEYSKPKPFTPSFCSHTDGFHLLKE